MHLAGRTKRIGLGTAILCADLRHPLDVAEHLAVADVLSGNRLHPGFGSSCTPEEAALFGLAPAPDEHTRHARFATALRTIFAAWRGDDGRGILPRPAADLRDRCWVAVNSVGAARVAGELNLNVLFSHLRTSEQHRTFREAYAAAGGRGRIAANRPVYVGESDAAARETVEPALRLLWRRFQADGKIPADRPEPRSLEDLAAYPIHFVFGAPESVIRQLRDLRAACSFDLLNIEVRWPGLATRDARAGLKRFVSDVAGKF
jgi:alkanesulfonate monooxygenase SsuD/methylene tetrahydromethanopterin reductase-like flavin-dependent oxidoreductase (luciferase family)